MSLSLWVTLVLKHLKTWMLMSFIRTQINIFFLVYTFLFLNYIFFMPCSHLSLGSAALCCLDKVHYWDVHKTCPTLSYQPFYLTEFVNTRTLTLYNGLTSRKIKTWRRISGKIFTLDIWPSSHPSLMRRGSFLAPALLTADDFSKAP